MVSLISGIGQLAVLLEAFGLLVPFVSFQRLKDFSWKRAIHDRANFLQGRCAAGRENLDGNVAEGCGLGRARQDLSAGCIRGELVQHAVLRSSSDHPNLRDALSTYLLEVAQHKTILEGQALEDGSHVRPRG